MYLYPITWDFTYNILHKTECVNIFRLFNSFLWDIIKNEEVKKLKNNSINARIKEVRTSCRLKQVEFGQAIGVKDSAIGRMEQEGSNVTEQSIMLICEKFHVRREWLVDGKGEMYSHPEDSLFAAFAQQYNLSPSEQNAVRFFLELPENERQSMLRNITDMANAIAAGQQAATDIDVARRNDAHLLLDQELATQEKEPSVSTTGSSATTAKIDA